MKRQFLFIGLLIVAFCIVVQAQQTANAPKAPFTPQDVQNWVDLQARTTQAQQQARQQNRPIGTGEPFKVLGNFYSVGVPIGNSFLLTSPQGHILMNTGFAESAEQMGKNIEALGFKLSDIKILLPTHWHNDGGGGTAYFKGKTNAPVYLGAGDIAILEAGGEGNQKVPPVKVDRAIFNGDVITLGPLSITAYTVPGHTPGSTSFTFKVREGNQDYTVFQYCCGQNIPQNFRTDPNYSDAGMRHTFEVFRKVLPVDVYVSGPSSGFFLSERLAKFKAGDRLAFVDRTTFPSFAAWLEVEYGKIAN